VRDIQSHIEEIYGASISAQTISNMTDRILPAVEEWRNRALREIYSILYIDGQRFKVRSDGQVKEKTVYTVLGIDILRGRRPRDPKSRRKQRDTWIVDSRDRKCQVLA